VQQKLKDNHMRYEQPECFLPVVQGRQEVNLLASALEMALAEVGAPQAIPDPPCPSNGSPDDDDRVSAALDAWSPRSAVTPEVAVWKRLEGEVIRQVSVQCHELGDLLERAVHQKDALLQVRCHAFRPGFCIPMTKRGEWMQCVRDDKSSADERLGAQLDLELHEFHD
jgi:hypothetical protein